MMLWQPSTGIWIPPFSRSPAPPLSPPAERRKREEEEIRRQVVPFRCPGLAPGAWREYEQRVMPAGIIGHRRSLKIMASASPLLTGLVYSYSFDSTSWLDNTASANHMTSLGSPTNPAGKLSNCIAFAGGPDGAYAAYASSMNIGPGACTITFWAYVHTKASPGRYLSLSGAAQELYCVFQGATSLASSFRDSVNGGHFVSADNYGNVPLDTWVFVMLQCSLTTGSIAVNRGTANTDATLNGGIINNSTGARLSVGAQWNAGTSVWQNGGMTGRVDELNAWNRALSSDELDTLYNSGGGKAYPFS